MTWPLGGPPSDVPVSREICSGTGALFGGWGLGLLADAAQRATGRRLRDLSAAFLRPVARGARLSVRCDVLTEGRALSHCRLDATDGDRPALTGTAVVEAAPAAEAVAPGGVVARPGTVTSGGVASPPRVPGPLECPERSYESGSGGAMMLDVRVAGGSPGSVLLWARVLCDVPDEVRLAVVSDHVPYLLRRTLPERPRVTTVSASLRLFGGPVAEWVLLDVSLVARAGRTAAGRVALWQDGASLAGVAEQTMRLSA
ncbi:acyl-CoA thioesterase domain-containing protein [Nonomuraea sp. C10]|uniref:acyl-CoA thioesterase domain-containing protein n=1 Tax=Nonomuraea sp. C10 TaxID=2600577 RepID=UPI0011CE35B3|nr:acyl-CoA thioesterase domain-containing protein [Nonomuraea sp. C10]TXK40331.1 thioesterase family protein [Nonomuraea sp. C10]